MILKMIFTMKMMAIIITIMLTNQNVIMTTIMIIMKLIAKI